MLQSNIVEVEPMIINLIEGKDWHAPIMAYLHHYYESDSAIEHTRMQQRVQAYQIIDNDLYKTSTSSPSSAASARPKAKNCSWKFT
jgi:hypothetical protein